MKQLMHTKKSIACYTSCKNKRDRENRYICSLVVKNYRIDYLQTKEIICLLGNRLIRLA